MNQSPSNGGKADFSSLVVAGLSVTPNAAAQVSDELFERVVAGDADAAERGQFLVALAADSELYERYLTAIEIYRALAVKKLKPPFYQEDLYLLAAADSSPHPLRLEGSTGEWTLTTEELLASEDSVMLVFRVNQAYVANFRGRHVVVTFGDQSFALGAIDRRGFAEAEISADVNLLARVEVRIESLEP